MITLIKDFFTVVLYQPLYNLLILLVWLIPGHSLGAAIIVLTVLIRLLLLPSSIKAAKAQIRIQALQPKINEIRKKHKDQMEQSQAMMALYREEGVSQFGACLPQLLQLPILIVLYQVFQHSLNLSNSSMLYSFIPRPETVNQLFFGIDLSQPERWVLPVVAALSQWYLSRLMMAKAPKPSGDDQDPTQMMMKQMNLILPAMTFFIGRTFPAAIAVYWIVTTVFGIMQQMYVNKNVHVVPVAQTKPIDVPQTKAREDSASTGKKDMLASIMKKRLEKKEKRSGTTITIRNKGK